MLKTGWWSRFGKWTRGQGCLTIHRCLQGKGSTFCQVLVQPGNQTLAYCFKLWYPINWANQVAVNFDHTFLYLLLTVLFLQCSSQDCFYPCTLCLYSSADQVQLEERKGQCLHAEKLVLFLVRHLQSDYSKNPSLRTYRFLHKWQFISSDLGYLGSEIGSYFLKKKYNAAKSIK